MGFFDSLNAWDNAIMSLGPCHWTLGLISGGAVDRGELCALPRAPARARPGRLRRCLRLLRSAPEPELGRLGRGRERRPAVQLLAAQVHAWLEQEAEGGGFTATPTQAADADYFRTWHWFHRFAMAGRTVAGFRRQMWDMARIRLRDIRAAPWGAAAPAVPDVPVPGGQPRPAMVGDVFTSEQALAMVMRWHVYRPGPHGRARGRPGAGCGAR